MAGDTGLGFQGCFGDPSVLVFWLVCVKNHSWSIHLLHTHFSLPELPRGQSWAGCGYLGTCSLAEANETACSLVVLRRATPAEDLM